jgi:hypothetical protein
LPGDRKHHLPKTVDVGNGICWLTEVSRRFRGQGEIRNPDLS